MPVKVSEVELKKELRLVLERHERPEQSIAGRELAQLFGYKDDRKIRLAIRELITDGLPVAALVEKPFGYYIITNRKQADEYSQSLKNRLIENAKRRRDFRIAADLWLLPGIQRRLL